VPDEDIERAPWDFGGGPGAGKELFELDGAAPDMVKAVIVDVTLEHFVATLAPGDGEVAALLYLEGLEPADRDATSDPSRIEGWWTRWADANIGMATGAAAGKRYLHP